MKITFIKTMIVVSLTGCSHQINPIYISDTEHCGAFTTKTSTNSNKVNYSIIYGQAASCTSKLPAPNTLIRLYDERLNIKDSVFTNEKGLYKIKITEGTYKIKAMQINAGIIETTYLDFNARDSVRVNLFLNELPAIKD